MTLRKAILLLMAVTAGTVARAQQGQTTMTVDKLFQLIESNSKTLQVKKTSVEFAEKSIEAAKSSRLPDIGVKASVSYNGDVLVSDRDFSDMEGFSAPHLGNSFALEAQQVVYAGGAVSAAIRMAELGKKQAEAGLTLTRQQQRFMALGQFLDLYKLSKRKQVYEENIATTKKLIENIEQKHQQGMALRNDITRYELQMESLRLGLRKLEDQQVILNHQLCNQLGLASTTIVPVVETELSNQGGNEAQWQQTAVESSPLMEQSRLDIQMADQELKMARSEMLPKVAVFAADMLNGPFVYDLPPKDINVNNWYVGIGIQYSLSSLFKSNKKVQRARLRTRQSNEQERATAESLNNDMQQVWTLYQQSYVELDTQKKSVKLARQNYEVVNERYLSQLALVTDMLDASNTLLNAELNEVDARINIIYAYYRMKFISGTL